MAAGWRLEGANIPLRAGDCSLITMEMVLPFAMFLLRCATPTLLLASRQFTSASLLRFLSA